jgi:transcriptional regulator with XRE-family HTH domain
MDNIGPKIKMLRLMHKLTQQQMAKKIEMEQSTYCKLEGANTKIDLDKLEKIGKIFNMTAAEIIDHNEQSNQDINKKDNHLSHPLDNDFLLQELKIRDNLIEHKDRQIEHKDILIEYLVKSGLNQKNQKEKKPVRKNGKKK